MKRKTSLERSFDTVSFRDQNGNNLKKDKTLVDPVFIKPGQVDPRIARKWQKPVQNAILWEKMQEWEIMLDFRLFANRFEVLSSGTGGSFGGQHSRAVESEKMISQIQKTIQNDMAIWEKSKQWSLSCYTYTKEEPCLPDLLDFSPEEIRLEAYNANAEGKADSYQQGLKTLITANQQKRRQLSRMSVSQIQEEIKKQSELKAVESMDAGSSVQQSSSGTTIFSENNTFGQSGGSGFGSNTPLFQSTGFSAVAGTSNQSSSLFGSGGATNQSNLFGQSNVTGLSGSVFGNTSDSSNQQTGMTGSTATGQSGLFDTNFSQSAAGNAGLFGVKPKLKTGLFGSASSTASSGVFGSEPQLQNNVGTISANHTSNSSLKSTPEAPLSREQSTSLPLTCSEEDIQAFKADSFVLGKIPECPPPLELC